MSDEMSDEQPPLTDGAWGIADLLGVGVTRCPLTRPHAPVYTARARMISIAVGLSPEEEERQIAWVLQRDVLERRN